MCSIESPVVSASPQPQPSQSPQQIEIESKPESQQAPVASAPPLSQVTSPQPPQSATPTLAEAIVPSVTIEDKQVAVVVDEPQINAAEAAATVIQATFRGYKTRKSLSGSLLKSGNKPEETVLVTSNEEIQQQQQEQQTAPADVVVVQEEETPSLPSLSPSPRGIIEDESATAVRPDATPTPTTTPTETVDESTSKTGDDVVAAAAAAAVNVVQRSSLPSNLDPTQAATKIQATYRGFKTRKELNNNKKGTHIQ